MYVTGARSQGKSWFGVIIVAGRLAKERKIQADISPYYAAILRDLFPHINLIKDNDIYIASFPRCDL